MDIRLLQVKQTVELLQTAI